VNILSSVEASLFGGDNLVYPTFIIIIKIATIQKISQLVIMQGITQKRKNIAILCALASYKIDSSKTHKLVSTSNKNHLLYHWAT
jgi:hypothetical protein